MLNITKVEEASSADPFPLKLVTLVNSQGSTIPFPSTSLLALCSIEVSVPINPPYKVTSVLLLSAFSIIVAEFSYTPFATHTSSPSCNWSMTFKTKSELPEGRVITTLSLSSTTLLHA